MDLSSFFNQFLSSVAEYKVCQNLLLVCSAMACFVGHFIYCYMAMMAAAALSPSLSQRSFKPSRKADPSGFIMEPNFEEDPDDFHLNGKMG